MRKRMVALLAGAMLMMATSAMASIIVDINGTDYSSVNHTLTYDFIHPSNASTDSGLNQINIVDFILDGRLGGADHTYTLVNSTTEKWLGSGAVSVLVKEIAGNANVNTFGYYTESPTTTYQLFNGPAGSGSVASFTLTPAQDFGFYLGSTAGNTFYTEKSLNTANEIHAAIFQVDNTSTYVLGFEDKRFTSGSDRDYQDMILEVTVAPVPEPGTMMLLGLGMLGMAVYGKRRMNNKEA
jgi:hypothetical protein